MDNAVSARRINPAVHSNHTAKRRHRIAFERPQVSLGQRLAGRGAARIAVFDNGADRLVELLRQIPRGLPTDNIVLGDLLTLPLARTHHAYARTVRVHRSL